MTDIQARIDTAFEKHRLYGTADGEEAKELVSIIKELQAQLSAKDDHLNFIWRWVERGKWDKNTGLKTAIDILAHYDAAPWYGNRKEWDTTHKEYDKEITEFVSDRAKLAEKDALIAELQNENELCRSAVIEEICEKYIGEIIKNYRYQCKNDPMIGPYSFDKEIAWHERLMRALRKQEWVEPPKGL